ncbi:MAG TPA: hypothetical protein VGL91_20115, partial [Acidobacteriota bacterium]
CFGVRDVNLMVGVETDAQGARKNALDNRQRTEVNRASMGKKTIVILLVGLTLASVRLAEAQQPEQTTRIGYLDDSTAAGSAELLDAFRKQMTQLGWVEGKNLAIEYRFGEGKGPDRLAELAVELVRLRLDVIVIKQLVPPWP